MDYALVCFFPAAPPESGAGSVSYDLARFLPGERLLLQAGGFDDELVPSEGLRVIQVAQRGGSGWTKLAGIPEVVERIVALLREARPTIVVLEGASWVVYHWWLLRRLRAALPGAAVVYHAHNVEYILRVERHGWLVQRITRWAESRVLRGAGHSFAASEVDRDLFERLYGVRPALLPNGVDLSRLADADAEAVAACRDTYGLGAETILFMGSYAYRPNQEAIDFLVKRVMPRVLERRPHARLAVIGGEIPYRFPWLLCPGVIPDEQLAPFVHGCVVSVAPIFSGSGTRLKILTSLAAGVPVVATAKGAEGLDLAVDREIVLADEPAAFAESVARLLAEPERRIRIGMRGREKVARRYDWRLLANGFDAEIRGHR